VMLATGDALLFGASVLLRDRACQADWSRSDAAGQRSVSNAASDWKDTVSPLSTGNG
jgi:hypothetical protein